MHYVIILSNNVYCILPEKLYYVAISIHIAFIFMKYYMYSLTHLYMHKCTLLDASMQLLYLCLMDEQNYTILGSNKELCTQFITLGAYMVKNAHKYMNQCMMHDR